MASHGDVQTKIALYGNIWPLYPKTTQIGDVRRHNFLLGPLIKKVRRGPGAQYLQLHSPARAQPES